MRLRKDSPLIHWRRMKADAYIASDVPAILKYTRNVYYIGNLEMAGARQGKRLHFYNHRPGRDPERESSRLTGMQKAAEKGGYEHFMLKEIHEQPKAVAGHLKCRCERMERSICQRVGTERCRYLQKIWSRIYIVACGSAYHVGMAAKYVMEDLAGYSGWSGSGI